MKEVIIKLLERMLGVRSPSGKRDLKKNNKN